MNELALFAGAGGGILGGKLLGWRTERAAELVKPGGRLVAILPASAKGKIFNGLDCQWHGPYDNEFAGTSISVVILQGTRR